MEGLFEDCSCMNTLTLIHLHEKNRFMSLQSTHTTTVNSLQRELEALRESNRLVKVQLRELEMGNDDLERHER